MACPTCDHTMNSLGYADGGTIWWCPRCGTVSHYDQITPGEERIELTPKLVERCREFETAVVGEFPILVAPDWRTIGIAESINLPGARQQ